MADQDSEDKKWYQYVKDYLGKLMKKTDEVEQQSYNANEYINLWPHGKKPPKDKFPLRYEGKDKEDFSKDLLVTDTEDISSEIQEKSTETSSLEEYQGKCLTPWVNTVPAVVHTTNFNLITRLLHDYSAKSIKSISTDSDGKPLDDSKLKAGVDRLADEFLKENSKKEKNRSYIIYNEKDKKTEFSILKEFVARLIMEKVYEVRGQETPHHHWEKLSKSKISGSEYFASNGNSFRSGLNESFSEFNKLILEVGKHKISSLISHDSSIITRNRKSIKPTSTPTKNVENEMKR